jgi:hypothetical protein
MNQSIRALTLASLVAALLILGCASPGASPGPSTSPAPTTSPNPSTQPTPAPSPTTPVVTQVSSAAQAAAVVFAREGIRRMGPLLPDLIGQSSWYEAYEEANGFAVKITVGSGDCQAGCIERHTWTYHVDYDATVTLVGDEGDDIGLPPASGTPDPLTLRVSLTAGPVCPVERNPPDPACAPRPVVNVEIAVYDVSGGQVASAVSGEDGVATLQLPAGAYYVVAPPVEGLMGGAEPLAFAGVGGDSVALAVSYDTGIR